MVKIFKKSVKRCWACGDPVHRYNAKYCLRCAKFGARMRTKHFPPAVVKAIWEYIKKYGYVCYYTGMLLDLENKKSPRYLVFDHWIPGDPHKIVLTSAFINTMKSDMLEDEFWDAVFQLADYKRLGKPVDIKDPVHWYRLHPPEK